MQSKEINLTKRKHFDARSYLVYFIAVGILVFFSVTLNSSGNGFFSVGNLMNIVRTTSMVAIMAVAMTFVVASGEIDLSVGAITAFVALTTAMLMDSGVAPGLAVAIGLGAGALVGFGNGILVTKVQIPSFIVTLGMMQLLRGIDMWMTGTQPVVIRDQAFIDIFGSGNVGPVASLAIWMIAVMIVGFIFLRKTRFGRKVLATGGNRVAAEYSGVNTNKIKLITFIIMGIAAGLAGLLYSGMMQSARYSFGQGVEIDVLAAVMIGGTSLSGGTGSIIGSVVGALLIGMINNGLIIMGLDVAQQMVVSGAIIILAVALSRKPEKN